MDRSFRQGSRIKRLNRFIYLISPNKFYNGFYKDLESVLKTQKVHFFQLRMKNHSKDKLIILSKKVKKITNKYKVKFIINDDIDLAIKCKSDGCHLGQKDGSIIQARNKLRKKILGITCHGSKKFLLDGEKNKADYLAIGYFYKSKLKPFALKANIEILRWAKKNTKASLVAIGGINPKNYKKLLIAGANYIAISSYIWNNPKLKPYQSIKLF